MTAGRSGGWRAFQLAVLAAVVLLAWRFIDFGRVWELVLTADPRFLAGLFVLAVVDRALMAWKWRQLLRSAGVPATRLQALDAYYRATAIGYVPFMVVGSDVLRGWLMVRWHGRTREVLASMIVEKLLGVISGSLLGVLGLMIVLDSIDPAQARLFAAVSLGGLALGLGVLVVSLYRPSFPRATALLGRAIPAPVAERLAKLDEAYGAFAGRKLVLTSNLGLTIVEQLVQTSMLLCAGLALDVPLPPLVFVAASAMVLLARRVARYVEGWGLAETVAVVLFSLVGLDASTALTVSLLAHTVTLAVVLPALPLLWRGSMPPAGGVELSDRSG